MWIAQRLLAKVLDKSFLYIHRIKGTGYSQWHKTVGLQPIAHSQQHSA